MPSNSPKYTFRTTLDVMESLKEIAKNEHRTTNNLINKIVIEYIEEYKKKLPQLQNEE